MNRVLMMIYESVGFFLFWHEGFFFVGLVSWI